MLVSIGSLGRSIFQIFIVYFYNCKNIFFQIGRLIWERSMKWSIWSFGRGIFHILVVYFIKFGKVFFQIGRLIWERTSRASMKWSIWSLDRMRNDLLKTFNPLFDRFKFHFNKHNILRFWFTSTSTKCPPWHQLGRISQKNIAMDRGHSSLSSICSIVEQTV